MPDDRAVSGYCPMGQTVLTAARARFEERVDRSGGPSACHPWTGSVSKKGYGWFWFDGKNRRANMVAFFFAHGHWPAPMCLHRCDNPPCCNDAHLREGTAVGNANDRASRNRQAKGSRNGGAKLTEPQAAEVKRRVLLGEGQSALAREFGISQTAVWEIKAGRKWAHL